MNFREKVRRGALLVAMSGWMVAAACSSEVTAPATAARAQAPAASAATLADLAASLKTYLETAVLARSTTLAAPLTASATIGRDGGTIAIPGAGFELVIPKGALTQPTTITVAAMAGNAIAYEFAPHGLKFKKPVHFRQNAAFTTGWWNATSGGYFKAADQVDTQGNKAKLDETLGLYWEGSWMVFDIQHFSGYLVSCA